MEDLKPEEEVKKLKLEVLRLETKLRDLHASDLVATKRALTTLQQHVKALQRDSEGISGNIATLDVDPFNQHVVEEELGALSVAALSTYVADRVIKASRVLDSREIRGVLWTLSGTYVAWRITFGFWKKLGRRTQQNINSKAELEHKYGKVSERIDVMHQLLERGDSDQQLSKSLKG